MELRVETADGSSLPKGCFVSIRVGDVQKQRRYENKGAFQFPAPAHTRKAKIDLYMHVATCSISVGPENKTSEVYVQPLEPGAPQPCLRVESSVKQEAVVDRETKMSSVKKEAVEYLSKWLIQERLGEAVKALLQKRPDDPIEFICSYLRAHASSQPEPLKKAEKPKVAVSDVLPFQPYYKCNVSPNAQSALTAIYNKFPAPKKPAKPALVPNKELEEVKSKARTALEMAFKNMAGDEKKESGFKVQPSVGTWLQSRPCRPTIQGKLPSHMKAAWNLQGLRPPRCMNVDERVEAERVITNALMELSGVLEGEYLPLQTSTSFMARPGGMTSSERKVLEATGLLLQANDPLGRGVFVTPKRDLAVWVNGDHHLQLISSQAWVSPEEAHWRLKSLEQALGQALMQQGYDFAVPAASSAKRLKGIRTPGAMSVDERCEVERVCTKAFLELTGELEGEYFPLTSSNSYPPRPGGMTSAEETSLSGFGLLLGSADATGRGVFATNAGDLAVMVNGESHMQILTRCPKCPNAAAKIKRMEESIKDAIRQSGYDYE